MPRLLRASRTKWIVNGQVNKEFLDKYAVGYDDDTMPESAKGQNKSYQRLRYMGTGYDMSRKRLPNGLRPLRKSPPIPFANWRRTWLPQKLRLCARAGVLSAILTAKTPRALFACFLFC